MPGFKPKKGPPIEKADPKLVGGPIKSSDIEASTSTDKIKGIRGMFDTAEPIVLAPSKKGRAKRTKELKELKTKVDATEEELEAKDTLEEVEEAKDENIDSTDLNEMKDLIENDIKGIGDDDNDIFYEPVPKAYISNTSRGFSEFIKQTYKSFILDPTSTASPDQEKYPYQRFIREYMRNDSPYRGILTYHGLGSGKTCTAIATAEALYSRGKKKIIVMTPASLRKNFLKEVSLCGFRHFRLNNFWTSMPVSDADARLFATSVLGVPESHLRTARSIWIPDFRESTPNYRDLIADEQTEIRKQILSILVWDEKKNPEGLIRFINYNGFTAKKLKAIACTPGGATFFNDSIIIIDEIHNVVRLMQGTIDPYLISLPGAKRLIAKEDVTVTPWNPSLCQKEGAGKNYMRGYLLYRLLLDAKNSKIVGLSGTPIINFPEELGILMNILHGYIPTITLFVQEFNPESQTAIKRILTKNIYIDFISVGTEISKGTKIVLTMLPYGVRKTAELVGVERMGPDEVVPSIDEIISGIKEELSAEKFTLNGDTIIKALPLLPPFGEEFRKDFIKGDEINNKIVLVKRLTGLISYYKGSRADLMPRIKSDVVVRVPMSVFSQKGYVSARNEEISKEKTKKSGAGEMSGVWAEVYEVGTGSQTSNYKMASRQACNFVFPSDVIRPKPKNKREARSEADSGNKLADIIDTVIETKNDEEFPELEDDEDEDVKLADDEDEALKEEILEGPPPLEGGGDEDGKEDDMPVASATAAASNAASTTAAPAIPTPATAAPATAAPAPATAIPAPSTAAPSKKLFQFKKKVEPTAGELEAAMKAKALAQRGECKSGVDEPYPNATIRAKECLATIAKYSLKLGEENGLETHSPKFAKMLENIGAGAGSSLVYSQFLDMEGIGIFRLVMNANGYSSIEIENGSFTKKTLESLALGPGGQPRYMTFSGNEDPDTRRIYLDIFNGNFNDLPEEIKSVLQTNKFINNHKGEIARVFCITSAGAEGLSLKCVRAVHIMEPYWNDVRLKQVKGRAIRIGSHLELPEADRDVSIYTYLTCFSQEAQVEKAGDKRIDETIRQADAIDRESAIKLKLPIPEAAAQYVFTTDERIYEIAQRKKTIANALENVMKSSAVDCELFSKENKDGTFECLSLKGAVGDFMYHPDINIDISESASKFSVSEKASAPVAKKAPVDYIRKKLGETIYRLKKVIEGDKIIRFDMYEDKDGGVLVGTAGVKGENPGPPVVISKKAEV